VASVTCIMGEPGSGKTRLAGTWPNPYWINLETDGNTTALSGLRTPNGIDVRRDKATVSTVVAILNEFKRLVPNKSGDVSYNGISVGSIIIDSIDAMQETDKYLAVIPSTKFKAMDERGWGKLADDMWPLTVALNDLPIPVVVISHTRERETPNSPVLDVTFNLQGSFRATMTRTFSEILVTLLSSDNKRYVLCQPFTTGTRKYSAKDRHQRLDSLATKGMVCIEGEDGYPPTSIAELITGRNNAKSS